MDDLKTSLLLYQNLCKFLKYIAYELHISARILNQLNNIYPVNMPYLTAEDTLAEY